MTNIDEGVTTVTELPKGSKKEIKILIPHVDNIDGAFLVNIVETLAGNQRHRSYIYMHINDQNICIYVNIYIYMHICIFICTS